MISVIAQFETTLASGISASATEGVLVSNVTGDDDGATIPNGDYGVVIDERNSKREYAIITIDGFDFTIVKRGLSFIDGDTEKAGNKFAHRKGAVIKIVSHPIITMMTRAFNGLERFGGIPKMPITRTISDSRHLVDKEYADALVTSSVPSLAVTDAGDLLVNINSGYYIINGDLAFYAGASDQALTDDADNYIQLVDGALNINTSAFSDDAMPLAKVTTVSGDISVLLDARAILSWIDIKASSGLGRDATGIFVDLATTPGLEFSSGKLQAKIKSAGGLVKDANGLSVDTGTTDGKIVKMTTGDKLPAVDGSNLTNLSAPQEVLLIASGNLKVSADNITTDSNTAYIKVKEVKLKTKGVVRVKFDLAREAGASSTVNGRIYLNGAAVGTERTSTSETYATHSEDITLDDTVINNLVQIYLKSSSGSVGQNARARNFRIYFDKTSTDGVVTLN